MGGKAARAAGAAILVAALLAGCGSSGGKALPPETPKDGGTFREGLVRLSSEDPARAQSVSERVWADQLYDGLTSWDPVTMQVRPALAQRWTSSDDGKVWTFVLRPDATAANGDAISATDVKATLQHIAKASSGSVVTDLLDVLAGFSQFTHDDAATDLPSVKVVDGRTVELTLSRPFAELPSLLGNPAFGIVHAAADGTPVTTGPMKLVARDAVSAVLQRTTPTRAHVDKVAVTFYDSVDASYAAFDTGQLDWSAVPQSAVDSAGTKYGRHLFRASLRSLFLAFNVKEPAVANPLFREAIVHAIDRPALVAKMAAPDATTLNGIVVSGVPGAESGGCSLTCTYDTVKAKDLLAKAFPDGNVPPLTLDVTEGAPFTDAALQQIIDNAKAAGITITVRRTPLDQYGAVTTSPTRQLFQASYAAAYPSADAFLPGLFASTSVSNITGLQVAAIDEALAKAQAEPDQRARSEDYVDIERKVLRQVPVVPLAQFPVDAVEQPTVRGVAPLPTGNFDVSTVWLDAPAAR